MLQINGTGYTINTVVGNGPGKTVSFLLVIDPLIFIKMPQSSEFSGTATSFKESKFDSIIISDLRIHSEYQLDDRPQMSLGWYFSQQMESMFIGRNLYPYKQLNLLKGMGTLADDHYNFTFTINKQKWKGRLVLGDNFIHVPIKFGWLDRTKNSCFYIEEFDTSLCTLQIYKNKYVLQTHNQTEFLFGSEAIQIGFLNNHYNGTRIFGAYPDEIVYTQETLLFFGAGVILLLLWTLVFQDRFSALFGYISTFIVVCIFVRLVVGPAKVIDRILRTNSSNMLWYLYIVGIALIFTAVANIYLISMDRQVQKITQNTLLTFNFIAILIGSTKVCEESILCVLLALAWCPITIRAALCTKNYYVLILLIVFYPLLSLTVVAPFMADIPEISSFAFPASHIFLLLPSLFLLAVPTGNSLSGQ